MISLDEVWVRYKMEVTKYKLLKQKKKKDFNLIRYEQFFYV